MGNGLSRNIFSVRNNSRTNSNINLSKNNIKEKNDKKNNVIEII